MANANAVKHKETSEEVGEEILRSGLIFCRADGGVNWLELK